MFDHNRSIVGSDPQLSGGISPPPDDAIPVAMYTPDFRPFKPGSPSSSSGSLHHKMPFSRLAVSLALVLFFTALIAVWAYRHR